MGLEVLEPQVGVGIRLHGGHGDAPAAHHSQLPGWGLCRTRQDGIQGLKKAHNGKPHLVFDGKEIAGLF